MTKPKFNVGDRAWVIHGCILTWISGSGYKKTDMAKEAMVVGRRRYTSKKGKKSVRYAIEEVKAGHLHKGVRQDRLLTKDEYLAVRLQA
jgi:hypothetical protein